MNEAPARWPGSSCRLRARPSTGRQPALISIHRTSPCPRPARLSSNSAVPPSRSARQADHHSAGRYVACHIPPPPCCLTPGPPRHLPNSLPVSVVRARLICVCGLGPNSPVLYLHMRVRPAHALADDNLPILPCSRLLPFLGSPFAYPRDGTGRRWTTRNSACGLLPRLRRTEGSTAADAFCSLALSVRTSSKQALG